jgi:DNA-binding response OmpR family regulator
VRRGFENDVRNFLLNDNEVRVLVVDDLDDAAQALAMLLNISGYSARTAIDGESALAMVEEFKPHCVLLDVQMPGINGLELTRRLRARYKDDIVLVAVTGGNSDDAKVAGTFELVDHYLTKPIEIEKLEKILPPIER